MTAKNESKLKMLLTLRSFLASNLSIVSQLPNFAEFMAALDAAILQIQANDEELQHFTTGVTESKNESRSTLETLTNDGARKLYAYASYTKNTLLQSETKINESDLRAMSDLSLLNTAKGLHKNIGLHLASLTPYLLTEATQTTLWTAIEHLEAAIPQVRRKQLSKTETSQLITQGFEAADSAIESMDTLVDIIRLSEPAFHANYKSARKVVDLSGGSLSLVGLVSDADSNTPIVDARVTFFASGSNVMVLEKKTAIKGGLKVKSLPEGLYDVTVTKIGYVAQTIPVVLSASELYTLEVKLVKG